MVESLNVSASAAILIYMLSQRIREQVTGWQLSDAEQLRLLTRWTMSSVRDYEGILRKGEQSGRLVIKE
jgi:tRNA (guanosine-2'-O-)-methyltransferase